MRVIGGVMMGAGALWCIGVIAVASFAGVFIAAQHKGGMDPFSPVAGIALVLWFAIPFVIPGIVAFFVGAWLWKSSEVK